MTWLGVVLHVVFAVLGAFFCVVFVQFSALFGATAQIVVAAFLIGVFLLVLSPWGDRFFDLMLKTRTATRAELDQMQNALSVLEEKAEFEGVSIPSNLRLRVVTDPHPNAMAYGRKTVAVSSGLLAVLDPEQLQGVLAHEVAHIVRKDTVVGAVIVAFYAPLVPIGVFAVGLALSFLAVGMTSGLFGLLFGMFMSLTALAFFAPFVLAWLTYYLFNILLSFTNRAKEYAADAWAVRLTKNDGLMRFFKLIEPLDVKPSGGLFAAHTASHPPTALREDKARIILESMEV